MGKHNKLIILVMATWFLATLAAWIFVAPPDPLVGAKARAPALPEKGIFDRADLGETLQALETTPLWGVDRSGKPLPKPQSKEEQAPIAWRVLATVVRPNERYALIATDRAPTPAPVREGEELPNGGKLITVQPQRVIHEDADGVRYIIPLNFSKSP